jgi:hypothetical protein
MAAVLTRLGRSLTAIFIIATTTAAAALPPAHIHLGGDRDDHDHLAGIEHSHWSPHGGASRFSIDDDDGLAIFVDHPGVLSAAAASVARPLSALAAVLAVLDPPAFARHAARLAGNAPRDGPHIPVLTLRGPPRIL